MNLETFHRRSLSAGKKVLGRNHCLGKDVETLVGTSTTMAGS